MLKLKKRLGLIALTTLALAGCKDPVHLPNDYDNSLFDNIPAGQEVVQNTKEDYYNAVMSSDTVYQKTVKDILKRIASIGHDYHDGTGTDVSKVLNDINYNSVADGELPGATFDNLASRAKLSMLTGASTSSYSKDNLFYEQKYVDSLVSAGSLSADFANGVPLTSGKFVTSKNQELDQYDNVFKADYTAYQKKNLYADFEQNYLTAEYIVTKSKASIGNTNARKIQVISLTDRADELGDAKKLLNAYVRDFVLQNYASQNYTDLTADFFKDADFSRLEKLWKGVTKEAADFIAKDRYDDFVILSENEEKWMRANGLISGSVEADNIGSLKAHTLVGKVYDDIRKVELGKENYNLVDSSLESSYTGSYAYSTEVGYRKAVDEIAQKDLVTDGIHLKSESLSAVPDKLKERIFDSKITSSKESVDIMKKEENLGKAVEDLTAYEKDGFRYLTKASTINGSDSMADAIIHYDTESSTYYLVRILDVIDTNALNENNTDSIYADSKKREQIMREVAYTMSTTGSYKTDAAVYWLSRTEIKYSDEDFLEYMKTNYQNVFKTDNPWAKEEKIILPAGDTSDSF